MKMRFFLVVVCAMLAGCQALPGPAKPSTSEPATAPAPAVAPAPEPKAPEGPPPGSPAARAQAQALLRAVAEQLNEGNEDGAREQLALALGFDPGNKTGICLQRGLTVDPLEAWGRESTSYTVRSGDTLGSIAQRAFGESCEFYLLARYNQIAVPSRLYVGQVVKIPGKVALAAPERTPKPADASGDAVSKAAPAGDDARSSVGSPRHAMRAAEVKAQIERHQRNAIAAFRRQDLKTAIREWDRLLELDPNNDLARARRQEAIDLQRRLNQVK